MRFTKMQATGNDFVVVEPQSDERDWNAESIRLSDRHFGVGSDGVLLVLPSKTGAFRMRMFNADGSESEMCGNGIRCVTKYAVERGLVNPSPSGIPVETKAGMRTVWPVFTSEAVSAVRVDMGKPILEPERIPVIVPGAPPIVDYPLSIDGVSLRTTLVSMGNPHAVAVLEGPVGEFPLEQIGPRVERHVLFPNRINFEIVNVLQRGRMLVRVWERGSGLTMACGTGACAAMVAARLKGLVDDTVTADLPGGALTLEWDGNGPVYMTGPVVSVFQGEWRN